MAVGDILTHSPLRNAARRPEGGYDFTPYFEFVQPLFRQADLVIGNLETPLAGAERGFGGYPSFNVPAELAANLKSVGFTTLVVTNNHALDRGWPGLAATINNVEMAGLGYVGAYAGATDKSRRLVSVYNGVMVGLLAYSYGFNGNPGPPQAEGWRLGYLANEEILDDLAEARRAGADFVVVNLHFGEEYQRWPNARQKELVGKILAGDPDRGLLGADLVLGHHPHMAQPVWIGSRQGQTQLVAYSLGNFISNQFKPYTNLGFILDCVLTIDENGRGVIERVQVIPTICHSYIAGRRRAYRVFPLAMAQDSPEKLPFLSQATLKKMVKLKVEMDSHLLSLTQDKATQ
jgi:poly-gamma-glutamate synthesis protein (capsule biosynthesis protein)